MAYMVSYILPDQRVMIVISAPKAAIERDLKRALTDDEFKAHVIARSIPEEHRASAHELPDGWVPPDTDWVTYRRAWRRNGTEYYVNMPHAREIHRDRLRKARKPLLEALDVQYMRATEKGESTAEIVSNKQALRDVTADPAIEAAQTPEELKAVWPVAIGVKS